MPHVVSNYVLRALASSTLFRLLVPSTTIFWLPSDFAQQGQERYLAETRNPLAGSDTIRINLVDCLLKDHTNDTEMCESALSYGVDGPGQGFEQGLLKVYELYCLQRMVVQTLGCGIA